MKAYAHPVAPEQLPWPQQRLQSQLQIGAYVTDCTKWARKRRVQDEPAAAAFAPPSAALKKFERAFTLTTRRLNRAIANADLAVRYRKNVSKDIKVFRREQERLQDIGTPGELESKPPRRYVASKPYGKRR